MCGACGWRVWLAQDKETSKLAVAQERRLREERQEEKKASARGKEEQRLTQQVVLPPSPRPSLLRPLALAPAPSHAQPRPLPPQTLATAQWDFYKGEPTPPAA